MRFRAYFCTCAAAVWLAGCGGTDAQTAAQSGFAKRPAEPAPEKTVTIVDLSRMLPTKGLKHSGIVMDHVAGLPKLPGGTLGDYESGGKKYQIFIVDTGSNQDAAFLLLDAKGMLKDPEYLASYGGYFGSDGSRPVFVFAKQRYLTGIVGLPQAEADPVARTLASRLK